MEKQEIRTFGRRHGKKLSARQLWLIENVLPKIMPGADADAILEIGFGGGEHVRELAAANPDTVIIGAEPFMNGVASLLSAITDEKTNDILSQYQNIRIWPDDVRDFLRDSPAKFKQIWILHPDPWPKAKHEKRRLLHAKFINTIRNHLVANGEIIIGTDHWEYYDWIVDQAKKTDMNISSPDIQTIQTRYQNKNMAGTAAPKYLVLTNG